MVKSPEEYLSGMNFSLDEPRKTENLSPDERAFVEKYLGLDAFEFLPLIDPGAAASPPVKLAEPEIIVSPAIVAEEAPPVAIPRIVVAEGTPPAEAPVVTLPKVDQEIIVAEPEIATPEAPLEVRPAETAAPTKEVTEVAVATEIEEKTIAKTLAPPAVKAEEAPAEATRLTPLRELLRDEKEIQMVSFYVAGQLFLLPVVAIREVLRHMELVKAPMAPDFVAGVINLRGRVTPLISLAPLLTNHAGDPYSDKNFIIICGSDTLRLGLIIDRINTMHVVPQEKIIWNAESKLGDAAEFLAAIVNLDEKVCGIVAPETITQKILNN